jgi:hypothetical protein
MNLPFFKFYFSNLLMPSSTGTGNHCNVLINNLIIYCNTGAGYGTRLDRYPSYFYYRYPESDQSNLPVSSPISGYPAGYPVSSRISGIQPDIRYPTGYPVPPSNLINNISRPQGVLSAGEQSDHLSGHSFRDHRISSQVGCFFRQISKNIE